MKMPTPNEYLLEILRLSKLLLYQPLDLETENKIKNTMKMLINDYNKCVYIQKNK